MDDSIAYQTLVALNVSRFSGKEYKERGQSLNSEKTILNNILSQDFQDAPKIISF